MRVSSGKEGQFLARLNASTPQVARWLFMGYSISVGKGEQADF
jgi:hypothetical protein